MVVEVIACRHCGSQDVIKHGKGANGIQRHRCHTCRRTFQRPQDDRAYPDGFRETVLAAYQERMSMRGVARVFGLDRRTLAAWLKKS